MKTLRPIVRRMARAPMFTVVVLLTLALGIGANTAIFSIINGVLIKALPYHDPESLVGVWHVAPGIRDIGGNMNCSPTMYFTYRDENHSLQSFGLWNNGGASITGIGDPEQVQALFFTHGVLDSLAVQPVLGRWFSREDDTPGTGETVILMYSFWQRHFAGDRSVIGKALTVDSKPRTIVGVMPEPFQFLNSKAEVILPQRFDRSKIYLGNFSYQGLGRLKPGATIQQANADVSRMLGIWLQSWPPPPGFSKALFENARIGPKVQPLKQEVVGDVANVLWVVMATIGIVLLIACANVANLLLVRAEGRQQELAVRAALGAGWGDLAREMLVESVLLGLVGGLLGLGFAYGGVQLLVAKGPAILPRLREIAIDPVVVAFSLGVSVLAGLLFGLIPVIKYAAPEVARGIRNGGGRSASQSRERHHARNVLVVVQVGLALVLLIGSALMIRTFQALRNIQPGFTQAEHVQMLRISIPEDQVKDPGEVMRMQQEMIGKLAAIPGVEAVSFGSSGPMEGFNANDVLLNEDKPSAPGQVPPIRRYRFVAPGYFKSSGTVLVAGRDFDWTDLYEKRNVTVVSENLAREVWGDSRTALGKRVREGMADPWREIVGVVGDVYDNGVQTKPPTTVYWPALMDTFWGDNTHVTRGGVFLVRTSRAGTQAFLEEARQAIWSVNHNLPVFLVRTVKDVYDTSLARTSFTLAILAIAGAMAMLLGVVGIYGVIAYSVSQRTREIGIRMALGAEHSGLRRMFVRHGLTLAAIGALLGLAAAAGLTRWMSSLLFGIAPLDPATYAGVSLLLIAAAALASYVPARRASTVDPVEALRAQ
jgi:putative ABC transport system permease protein